MDNSHYYPHIFLFFSFLPWSYKTTNHSRFGMNSVFYCFIVSLLCIALSYFVFLLLFRILLILLKNTCLFNIIYQLEFKYKMQNKYWNKSNWIIDDFNVFKILIKKINEAVQILSRKFHIEQQCSFLTFQYVLKKM